MKKMTEANWVWIALGYALGLFTSFIVVLITTVNAN